MGILEPRPYGINRVRHFDVKVEPGHETFERFSRLPFEDFGVELLETGVVALNDEYCDGVEPDRVLQTQHQRLKHV